MGTIEQWNFPQGFVGNNITASYSFHLLLSTRINCVNVDLEKKLPLFYTCLEVVRNPIIPTESRPSLVRPNENDSFFDVKLSMNSFVP